MTQVSLVFCCVAALAGSPEGSVETTANEFSPSSSDVENSESRFHWGLEGAVGPSSTVLPRNYQELWGLMGKVVVGARAYGRRFYLGGQAEGSFSTLPVQVSHRRAKQTFGSVGLVASPGLRFGVRHMGVLALSVGWVYMRRTVYPVTNGMTYPDQQTFFGPSWGMMARVELENRRTERLRFTFGGEVRHLPLRVDDRIRHDLQLAILAGVAFDVR